MNNSFPLIAALFSDDNFFARGFHLISASSKALNTSSCMFTT